MKSNFNLMVFGVLYFCWPLVTSAQLKEVYGPQIYCKGSSATLSVRSFQTPCNFQFTVTQWKRDGVSIPNTNGALSIQVDKPGNYSFDFHVIQPDCSFLKDSVYSTSPYQVYGELEGEIITEGNPELCKGEVYRVTVIKSGAAAPYSIAQSYTNFMGNTIPLQIGYGDTTVFEFDSTVTCSIGYGSYYATPGGSVFAKCQVLNVNTTLNNCTGLAETTPAPSINIYPNPTTNGKVTLATTLAGQFNIQVFNILGKQVYSSFNPHSTPHAIDLSNAAKGIYYLQLIHEKTRHIKKIMLE